MARAVKLPYSWNKVTPGDIVSFRYKNQDGHALINTILVLNPRINKTLKNGENKRYLTGIKLEESNKVTLRLTATMINIFELIGEFKKIHPDSGLYKLHIKDRFMWNKIKGIKETAYDLISKKNAIKDLFRTYDYLRAKQSAVFIEPVILLIPEDIVKAKETPVIKEMQDDPAKNIDPRKIKKEIDDIDATKL